MPTTHIAKELAAAAVGVAERLAHAVHLVFAGGALDLHHRFAESRHAAGAERLVDTTPPMQLTGNRTVRQMPSDLC